VTELRQIAEEEWVSENETWTLKGMLALVDENYCLVQKVGEILHGDLVPFWNLIRSEMRQDVFLTDVSLFQLSMPF
jgi:hypothetical protein